MSANVYVVKTFQDLLNIPADRRAAFLRDLEYGLSTHELLYGVEAQSHAFTPEQWIDDGKHDVLIYDRDGNSVMTLEVTN